MKRIVFLPKCIVSSIGLVLLIIFTITSCKKNSEQIIKKDNDKDKSISTFGFTPPPLDWENIDYMPTPPGLPQILVPWASGASRQFAAEMANDYKSLDGWVLVYNTFNNISVPDNWYFILYNKYRGLMRMYYYVPSGSNFITSKNIIQTLAIEGSYSASSPLMNFAGQDIININSNSSFGSQIEPYQVAPATWYILQYELAYDQNMSSQSYSSFNFLWTIRSGDISNISLNGTQTGSLTGIVSTPGTNFTISPSFSISGANNSNVIINGSSDAEKLKPTLGQTIVNTIKGAILNGAQGIIKNILSGIFKKSTSNTPEENVNLKIKTNISLNGTLTSNFLLTSPSFSIPGYDQTSTTGQTPAYNETLGVFYLSNRPTINITYTHIPIPTCAEPGSPNQYYRYNFTVDNNSFQYIFNPAVTSIASIQNIQTDILLPDRGLDILPCAGVNTQEFIDNQLYYKVTPSVVTLDPTIGESILYTPVYLRVSFDVVPNNGTSTVRIAKTFAINATIQHI